MCLFRHLLAIQTIIWLDWPLGKIDFFCFFNHEKFPKLSTCCLQTRTMSVFNSLAAVFPRAGFHFDSMFSFLSHRSKARAPSPWIPVRRHKDKESRYEFSILKGATSQECKHCYAATIEISGLITENDPGLPCELRLHPNHTFTREKTFRITSSPARHSACLFSYMYSDMGATSARLQPSRKNNK